MMTCTARQLSVTVELTDTVRMLAMAVSCHAMTVFKMSVIFSRQSMGVCKMSMSMTFFMMSFMKSLTVIMLSFKVSVAV